jgi:hypothetical protein
MLKRVLLILFVLFLSYSCKTTKNTTGNLADLKSDKIVKNHYSKDLNFHILKAQMIIKYKGKDELPSINASMRMIRDSVIWISFSKLGFQVGKIMILPDSVVFYEKINKKYFDGDYRLISEQIGTEMDFKKVQNLFFGQPLIDLRTKKLKADTDKDHYRLIAKKKKEDYSSLFWFDPVFFNLTRESFIWPDDQKKVNINYTYTNKKESLNLPRDFIITLITKKGDTKIEVLFKKAETVPRLTFPFKLPEGYKEIKLK